MNAAIPYVDHLSLYDNSVDAMSVSSNVGMYKMIFDSNKKGIKHTLNLTQQTKWSKGLDISQVGFGLKKMDTEKTRKLMKNQFDRHNKFER